MCAADKETLQGASAVISLPSYKSHASERAGASNLLVESHAVTEGLAGTEWACTWFGLAQDLEYRLDKRGTLNRRFEVSGIISTEQVDALAAAVTDAKSLYDNLTREQFSGAEEKAPKFASFETLYERLEELPDGSPTKRIPVIA